MNRSTIEGSIVVIVTCATAFAWQGTGKPDAGQTSVQESKTSGMAFRLQKCHYESSTLTCDFTLTSLQGDTAVNFYSKTFLARSSSRMVTAGSAEHLADSIQLAGREMNSSTRFSLVSGNVTDGQISFQNLPQKPAKIALLSIRGTRTTDRGAGSVAFEAQFRNVGLQ